MKNYKFIFLFLMVLLVNSTRNKIMANDIPTYDYFPKGINYLDGNNFIYTYLSSEEGTFSSINNIKVKGSVTYKILIIPYQELSFSFVNVKLYNNKMFISNAELINNVENGECMFTTPDNANYISIEFSIVKSRGCSIELYDINNYVLSERSDLNINDYVNQLEYEGPIFDLQEVDEEGYYYMNASNPTVIDDISASIIVLDNCDGNITSEKIITNNEYVDNIGKVGVYRIDYRSVDKSNNESFFTLYINVKDDISPTINGKSEYYVYNNEKISVHELIKSLFAVDNHDKDINDKIEVYKDNYTDYCNIPGKYDVLYRVYDSSLNVGYFKVEINVIEKEDEAPKFYGTFSYDVNTLEVLTINDILENITAIDDVDGDISENIWVEVDAYSFGPKRVGTWSIILGVKDSKNNFTYQTVNINVYDREPPKFYIDTKNIYIELNNKNNNLEIKDFVNFLAKTKYIKNSNSYTVVSDTYSKNKKSPGTYNLSLDIDSSLYNLEIVVKEEKSTLFSRIIGFFRRLYRRIFKS